MKVTKALQVYGKAVPAELRLEHYVNIFNTYEESAKAHFLEYWEPNLLNLPVELRKKALTPHDLHWYYTNMGYIAIGASELFGYKIKAETAFMISDFWFGWRLIDIIADEQLIDEIEQLIIDYLNALVGRPIKKNYEQSVANLLEVIKHLGYAFRGVEYHLRKIHETRRNYYHYASKSFKEFHNVSIRGGLLSGNIIYQIIFNQEGFPADLNLRRFLEYCGAAGNLVDNLRDKKEDERNLGVKTSLLDSIKLYVDVVKYTWKAYSVVPAFRRGEVTSLIKVSFINAQKQYGFKISGNDRKRIVRSEEY